MGVGPGWASVKGESQLRRPGGAVPWRSLSGAETECLTGLLLGGDDTDDDAAAGAGAGEEVDAERAAQEVGEAGEDAAADVVGDA